VQTRLGDLVRVNGRTNEDVNEEWTCDRGKFGQYYVNSTDRVKTPLVRRDGVLTPVSWGEALSLVADKIRAYRADAGPDSVAGIGSTRCTLEENYLFGKLFRSLIGTNNVDHRMRPYPFEPMQTSIADLENFKTIVSVGMKLDFDQPIVYLRVFKAVSKRGAEWVKADGLGGRRRGAARGRRGTRFCCCRTPAGRRDRAGQATCAPRRARS
jgi:predicted molibdopterin-dependent oxidoreductase YjgC